MKKLFLMGVILAGLISSAMAAEPANQMPNDGMKTIFDYQKEVGLSDKQVTDMKKIMNDLQATLSGKANELNTMRETLRDLINKKDDIKSIRSQMQKIADMQVENSCMDIEASRKVEEIMKPEQIAKWKEIQKKFIEEMQAAMKAKEAKASK